MSTSQRRRSARFGSAPLALFALTVVLGAGLAGAAAAPAAGAAGSGNAAGPLLGFTAAHAADERALEARFDAGLRRADLAPWLKRLSARPHHLGSPYDKENVDFVAGLFRSWGFDTHVEEFRVLFPTPKERLLEMIAPTPFKAALAEPPLAEDSTSGQTAEQLPVFNVYSRDGDVTGDLVYVNFGVPKDYEELERRGIDIKGKIVIARYYGSWRGIKPKVAAEHGAIGCIIYSDPHEDGYFRGDVYPKGGWRSASSAQRGSVEDMPVYPGDPLTPGVGATADAKRLDIKDAQTITKIPVLPISYGDAEPLLRALAGPMAPEGWRGSLPFPYHLGPGPTKVHLKVEFDWKLVPAYDVIARLPGSEEPDEWVLRGNHEDGWVNGATDPLAGLVAELEEARTLGDLVKGGWHPKRTVIYTAWDGEEEGLLGSTEWAETHAAELQQKAVVYINSDTNGRGFLEVGGSHTLEKLMTQVAHDVTDPESHVNVADRRRAAEWIDGDPAEHKRAKSGEMRISALGSGSDYSPFLQHLGIASLNLGYGGEGEYGQYHSIYDTYDHYMRFQDPTMQYGVTLAETAGRVVLRMADADVLPFDFQHFTDTVGRYIKEVSDLSDTLRQDTDDRNQAITERYYELAADPTQTWVTPKAQEPVPHINFAPLENAREHLQKSSQAFQAAYDAAGAGAAALSSDARHQLDEVLAHGERALLGAGLPRRPWYMHQIYAPGFYTGYGVKTLPGVREAIEERHWREADDQVAATSKAIDAFAAQVDRATALLQPAGGAAGGKAAPTGR